MEVTNLKSNKEKLNDLIENQKLQYEAFMKGVVEYQMLHGHLKQYKDWSENNKTFVILNGGTTNNDFESIHFGSLNEILNTLCNEFPEMAIATFNEPDLGNQLTSVNLLVSELVYNEKKYPFNSEEYYMEDDLLNIFGDNYEQILKLRSFIKSYKLA